MQHKSRPFFLVFLLAFGVTAPCYAEVFDNIYLPVPDGLPQKTVDKAHQYIHYSYGRLIPIIPFVGEIARALALTVTNPTALRLLHGLELAADTIDTGSRLGFALTKESTSPTPPHIINRFMFGLGGYDQIDAVKTAAELTWHAGNLARYKKSFSPAQKKALRTLRDKRLKELFLKRLPIMAVASYIASKTDNYLVTYYFLILVALNVFKVGRHNSDFENTMLKKLKHFDHAKSTTKKPTDSQPDWQKDIDAVISKLGKKK